MAYKSRVIRQVVKVALCAIGLLAVGCAQLPRPSVVGEREQPVVPLRPMPQANGAIFQASYGYQPLFEDRRPRMVGDILTIVLNEQVSASKSSAANATRDGSASFTPTIMPQGLRGLGNLAAEVEGQHDFAGSGGAQANNSFTGTLTVSVVVVMPNGNLKVHGEKQIAINQGTEFIRFSGIVNPRTITGQNTVPSTQVAEARIEYIGDGYINEAQTMGWLQRFFLNVSPF